MGLLSTGLSGRCAAKEERFPPSPRRFPKCVHKEGSIGPGCRAAARPRAAQRGHPAPGRTIALSCTNKAALSEAQERRNRRIPCRSGGAHPVLPGRERCLLAVCSRNPPASGWKNDLGEGVTFGCPHLL